MSNLKSIQDEESKQCIYNLSERLMRHFDISYETSKVEEFFHLYAYHRNDFNKSFLTKSTVYEGYSVFEHILVRHVDHFDISTFENFKNTLINITPSLVSANKYHKRSVVTGIIICSTPVTEECLALVRQFFLRKTYKLCFHGWSETQMLVYSTATKNIYYPKNNSKELKKLFSFI